ncbi:hypothetical protein GA0115246_1140313 [Streptomyces sp. SolWspMP-sol7th]|nr:hypothetical protein GA0115246_1140313 [Streptomyces sp. SolWspMP-sol7th]
MRAREGTSSRTVSRNCPPITSGSEPSRGGCLPSWPGIEPKYFSTQARVCSGSMSPTTERTALFGA